VNFSEAEYIKCALSPRIIIDFYTVENLTWYISRIDPVTFKTVPGIHKKKMHLYIGNLMKLKS
jgi:hypothetical protein